MAERTHSMAENERETKENTAKLEDELVARLRAWVRTNATRVHRARLRSGVNAASITFTIQDGDVCYLDDNTPYLSARVEERTDSSEVDGWFDEAAS